MSGNLNRVEFSMSGDQLVAELKGLLRAGNARQFMLTNEQDRTLLDIPLTAGAVVAVFLPLLAVLGTIGALGARSELGAMHD